MCISLIGLKCVITYTNSPCLPWCQGVSWCHHVIYNCPKNYSEVSSLTLIDNKYCPCICITVYIVQQVAVVNTALLYTQVTPWEQVYFHHHHPALHNTEYLLIRLLQLEKWHFLLFSLRLAQVCNILLFHVMSLILCFCMHFHIL